MKNQLIRHARLVVCFCVCTHLMLAGPVPKAIRKYTIEQHEIDADTAEYALTGAFGIKDTVTSQAIAGFSIPVRPIVIPNYPAKPYV